MPTSNDERSRSPLRDRPWLLPVAAGLSGAALSGAALWWQEARRAEALLQRFPPLGRFVAARHPVHITDAGRGPPVLIIHGVGGSLYDFAASPLPARLSRHRRVIMLDRPGYGHSRPGPPPSLDESAALFGAVLDACGVAAAHVVGHSFGALLALGFSALSPERVTGLTLLNGLLRPGAPLVDVVAMSPRIPLLADIGGATVSPPVARLTWPVLMGAMFEPCPVPPGYEGGAAYHLSLTPSAIATATAEVRAANRLTAEAAHLAPHVRAPITVICGESDRVCPAFSQSIAFATNRPGTRLITVPGVGHMIHHAAADEIAMAVFASAAGRR